MSDTRQRISALALIYRALYQSPDLRSVDVRQFLEELIGQISAGDGARPNTIRTELDADDLEIDPDKLAPLALFAVEAIANTRKHVFVEGEGADPRVFSGRCPRKSPLRYRTTGCGSLTLEANEGCRQEP